MNTESHVSNPENNVNGLNKLKVFTGKLVFGGVELGIVADDLNGDSRTTTIICAVMGAGALASAYKDYKDLRAPTQV